MTQNGSATVFEEPSLSTGLPGWALKLHKWSHLHFQFKAVYCALSSTLNNSFFCSEVSNVKQQTWVYIAIKTVK